MPEWNDRPVIIIDLDNVVYPFVEVMATLVHTYIKPSHTPKDLMEQYESWNMWEDWEISKGQFDWIWEQSIRKGHMYGTPEIQPIDGAVDALWQLSDAEWHIHIVTDRLNKFRLHDSAAFNTITWLAAWGIPYRSLSFTGRKEDIHAEAIVDDKPSNLVAHPAPQRFLYPAKHNQNVKPFKYTALDRALPWTDLVVKLT